MVPTLIAISLVTFVFMHATPGSPIQPESAQNNLSPTEQAALKKQWGLDKPFYQQYLNFMAKAVRLDFGNSFVFKTRSVSSMLRRQLKPSIELGIVALAIAVIGGLALATVTTLFFVPVMYCILRRRPPATPDLALEQA